ncbi:hypothetical protein PG994_004115 [Apiospora phragmitis]|uniref:Uncharacterized protein n=1 Tax=Apiospora phragmitis TaxID=2905665 RepID=A0ABR1VPP5_9PEZI
MWERCWTDLRIRWETYARFEVAEKTGETGLLVREFPPPGHCPFNLQGGHRRRHRQGHPRAAFSSSSPVAPQVQLNVCMATP